MWSHLPCHVLGCRVDLSPSLWDLPSKEKHTFSHSSVSDRSCLPLSDIPDSHSPLPPHEQKLDFVELIISVTHLGYQSTVKVTPGFLGPPLDMMATAEKLLPWGPLASSVNPWGS